MAEAFYMGDGEHMTDGGLAGAVLYAKDLHNLVQFYSALAGLDVTKIEKGFALLGRQPTQLMIVQIPEQIASSIHIAVPPERRENTPIKLVFAVKNIADARIEAAQRGGSMNAVEREWEFEGVRVCDGCDPEGNVFQIRRAVSSRKGL